MNETINIQVEYYEQLRDAYDFLHFLESAGVDNWEGYEYAISEYQKFKEENA